MNIKNRRECFFDDALIDTSKTTAEFLLHNPVRKEVVMVFDKEWEGDGSSADCLVFDGEEWRLHYIGRRMNPTERDGAANYYNCVITSKDGIHWQRPTLERLIILAIPITTLSTAATLLCTARFLSFAIPTPTVPKASVIKQ